ncbi:Dehydrogenase reductase SDR member 4 [Serendipita sp. 396]|nr:Dehydrogenase reductase SDR member 4 [Serendipita sp. 396]KAG8809057.1 Dehydrogenase reductase SDR member 4 [Serendipita sp. 401]KAG9020962.1 Dehydrogenase reductase SDR member 4 [Serendipita sp. 407]
MNHLAGKTALVTGSRGIAESIVRNLFANGLNIIIVSQSESCEKLAASLRSAATTKAAGQGDQKSSLENTAQSIKDMLHIGSHGSTTSTYQNKAVAIRCDLSSAASAAELATKAVAVAKDFHGSHGDIDYLIHCAGILPMASLEQVDEKLWNKVFAINVTGPVFLTKSLAPHIAKNGKILFFSSSLTITSTFTTNYLPYLATKGVSISTRVTKASLMVNSQKVPLSNPHVHWRKTNRLSHVESPRRSSVPDPPRLSSS